MANLAWIFSIHKEKIIIINDNGANCDELLLKEERHNKGIWKYGWENISFYWGKECLFLSIGVRNQSPCSFLVGSNIIKWRLPRVSSKATYCESYALDLKSILIFIDEEDQVSHLGEKGPAKFSHLVCQHLLCSKHFGLSILVSYLHEVVEMLYTWGVMLVDVL